MQYNDISELPERVRQDIPRYALRVYLEAYNEALYYYVSASKKPLETTIEEIAGRIARAVVKALFENDKQFAMPVNFEAA